MAQGHKAKKGQGQGLPPDLGDPEASPSGPALVFLPLVCPHPECDSFICEGMHHVSSHSDVFSSVYAGSKGRPRQTEPIADSVLGGNLTGCLQHITLQEPNPTEGFSACHQY